MTIHVRGLSELNAFLDTFEPRLRNNVMRRAMRRGVKVILPVAKANIHSVSGELARGLKIGTRIQRGVIKAYIKATGKHKHIHRWVEFGTRPHPIPKLGAVGVVLSFGGRLFKSVQHPGARPHPFARPAMDQQGSAAVVEVGNALKEILASKHGLDTSHITVEGDE